MTKTDSAARKAFATLRFEGDDLDTAALSELLDVAPTLAYRKGEPFILGKRGLAKVGRTGYWLLNTKDRIGTPDPNAHAAFLETILTGGIGRQDGEARFQNLRTLVETQGLSVLATLFWFGAAGANVPAVDPRFRKLIDDLQGEIETDFTVQSRDPRTTAGRAA
jgi:hypothetical protein